MVWRSILRLLKPIVIRLDLADVGILFCLDQLGLPLI